MKQLVYVSQAVDKIEQSTINAILTTAKNHNSAQGITGMLLFNGTYFLQLLEGPDGDVDTLLERIHKDPRHKNIKLLCEIETTEFGRICHNWNMLYKHSNEISQNTFLGKKMAEWGGADGGDKIFQHRDQIIELLKEAVKTLKVYD